MGADAVLARSAEAGEHAHERCSSIAYVGVADIFVRPRLALELAASVPVVPPHTHVFRQLCPAAHAERTPQLGVRIELRSVARTRVR